MSRHTNKYYQLIKVMRSEKEMTTLQKALRDQRMKMKLDKANNIFDEGVIASIIDKDNLVELDRKDKISLKNE